MHAKNIEIFPKKKKTKSINMFADDIEISLKRFNFFWKYKKLPPVKIVQFFLGNSDRDFLRAR